MLDRPAALDVRMPQASAALLTVLTIGVGVLVANLYYAQPLIASIAAEFVGGVVQDLEAQAEA